MQSLTGPAYAFAPVVGHGFGFVVPGAPPMPGPWTRTKFVLRVLAVTAFGVTPSPVEPAGGTSAGLAAFGAHWRNGPTRPLRAPVKSPAATPTSCVTKKPVAPGSVCTVSVP